MAESFARPLICPVLIGRTAYLETLEDMLKQVQSGRGQTVLIAGEAGIGKSRLVCEARAQAERLGFLTLEGYCFEPDRSLPYAPFLDLLRARFAGRPAKMLAQELGLLAPEIVKLLPELGGVLAGLIPSAPLDPEPEKRRLFHALTHFFTGLAAIQPVLVVIEDLHWSDDTSLDCLLHLARLCAPRPLLLLLTYRSDELSPNLSHFLAELDRGRLAIELIPGPLSLAEVDALLRVILALERPVRADFLHAVYSLTEGNPFFIEEVLKTLAVAGEIAAATHAAGSWGQKPVGALRIPRSVQDAVRRRTAQLSAAARQVLALAAVAGRRFDFSLLQALTGREERDLLPLVKELIGTQLVVESSAEQFAFRHALTREAICAELLARERRVLHHTIAEALERIDTDSLDPHLEDLAYHFYEARVWTKTMEYARRAGERAQALYAPRAALEQFNRALAAAQHLGSKPPVQLYQARGQAYETLGEFELARADYEHAWALVHATDDHRAEWRSLIDLGFLWLGRNHEQAGDFFRRALDLARALGDPATLAHSLNRLGNWYITVDQPLQAQTYHEEALAIFQMLGDRPGLAATLDLLGLAAQVSSDLKRSVTCYEQAVALFRDLGDRQGLTSSLTFLSSSCAGSYYTDTMTPVTGTRTGRLDAEEALEIARAIGWRAGEAYALYLLSDGLGARGEYGRALARAQASLKIAEEIEHQPWMAAAHCGLGALYLDLLVLPMARQHLERGLSLAHEIGSLHWVRGIVALLASTYIQQPDLVTAESLLGATFDADTTGESMGQRMIACTRAELALAAGEPSLALRLADQLITTAPNLAPGAVIPRLWKLRGAALAALGQTEIAGATLRAAREAVQAQNARTWLWRIDSHIARLCQAQGRRTEADQARAAARALVEELAATIPDLTVAEEFRRGATAQIPVPPRVSGRTFRHECGELTAREWDVAALITQGKSNRAIAEELVLSERTVEGHVANILSKFGFTARTQIAAWVVSQKYVGGGQ